MKRLMLLVLLLGASVYADGAAPSPPSPFTQTSTQISNPTPTPRMLWTVGTSASNSKLTALRSGTICILGPYDISNRDIWRLGSSTLPWSHTYTDSLYLSSGGTFYFGAQRITSFFGDGIYNSGGFVTARLGSDIVSGEIVDSTILPQDLAYGDTAWIVAKMHRGAVVVDSQFMTKEYIDHTLNAKEIASGAPTNGQGLFWDDVAQQVVWDDPPGAAGGDNITVDTVGGTIAVTDPVFSGSVTTSGDTIFFAGGSFSIVADTTYNWLNSRQDSIEAIDVDTIHVDNAIVFPNGGTGTIDSLRYLYGGGNNVDFATRGSNSLNIRTYALGELVLYHEDLIQWRFDGDTIRGSSLRGGVINNIDYIDTDSMIVAGQLINGTEDIINQTELTTALTPYVLTASENWRDGGQVSGQPGDSVIQHITDFGAGSTQTLTIRQTNRDTDSTYVSPSTGSLVLKSGNTAGDGVILQGAAGNHVIESPVISNAGITLKDTVGGTSTNADINDVNTIYADTAFLDYALRLSVGALRTTYVTVKGPSSLTGGNYTLALPTDDGTAAQALLTDGAGATYWGSVAGGSGTGDIESVDAAGGLTGGGTTGALTVAVGAGTGITVNANDVAIDPTVTATVTRLSDTSAHLRDNYIAFHNLQGATTYGDFDGSDSLWILSAAGAGDRALTIVKSHTGGDTTKLLQDPTDGLIIGVDKTDGVTILGEDTTKTTGTFQIGLTGTKVTQGLWDTLWNNTGGFRGSGGVSGDITTVGSMTANDVFMDGTADEDWIGLGASAGRVQFEVNNAGAADDAVEIPDGQLTIGTSPSVSFRGLSVVKSSSGEVALSVQNTDSVNGATAAVQISSTAKSDATAGGDAALVFNTSDAGATIGQSYYIGIDRSDSMILKIGRSSTVGTTTGFELDSVGGVRFPSGAYKATSAEADSAYATLGYVKARTPYYNTATDAIWNYPTDAADTSQHATFPYTTVYDTTHLVKASTSTGNDTLFGLVIPFYIQDSCTIDSFIIWAQASTATALDAKIDSIHFTYEGADVAAVVALTSYTTDISGNTMARTAVALSRTATPGEIIRARPVCALKGDDTYIIIHKAQIKGSRR